MLRKSLVILIALAFVSPAMAYEVIWNGDSTGVITIEFQLDCWIQIDWQDPVIEFDGNNDYYCSSLWGTGYSFPLDPGGQGSTFPWAGDQYYCGAAGMYYESFDGAYIYVHSNNNLQMWFHVNGDLAGTINSSLNTIPTWITCCLAPFVVDDTVCTGTVPMTGQIGQYCWDPVGDPTIAPGPTFMHDADPVGYNYPSQYPFPCVHDCHSWLGPVWAPEVYGTIGFLARIHRHGMLDPGDQYSTTVDVHFLSPP